jgi:hypothetical protein
MTNAVGSIRTKAADLLIGHIKRSRESNSYAAKTLILTSAGLDVYSNVVDYQQLKKNKELKKEEREYLKAFKLTNAVVEGIAVTAAGFAVTSDRAQKAIIKGLSRISKSFEQHLTRKTERNIMKLSSLLGAILIAKRIVAPVIVTPLASLVKDEIHHIEKNRHSEVKSTHKDDLSKMENIFEHQNKTRYKED